jgi:uncharacterized protein YjbI with pentapeptide repeats
MSTFSGPMFNGGVVPAGTNLDGIDFSGVATGQGANAATLDASPTMPLQAYGATFDLCSMMDANLKGAQLVRASLRGTLLARANLDGANLDGADLSGACLQNASMIGTNLQRAKLANVNWGVPASLSNVAGTAAYYPYGPLPDGVTRDSGGFLSYAPTFGTSTGPG